MIIHGWWGLSGRGQEGTFWVMEVSIILIVVFITQMYTFAYFVQDN